MKLSNAVPFFLLSAKARAATHRPVVAINTVPGINGHFNQCPAGSFVTGLCSSGKHSNCLGNQDYVAFSCESNPRVQMGNATSASWICGGNGQQLACPNGQVMVGLCGAGEDPDCHSPCPSKSYGAIKCAVPMTSASEPKSLEVGEIQWQRPQHFASPISQCPANTMACGACQSGQSENCHGSGTYGGITGGFAIGCCPVESQSSNSTVLERIDADQYDSWEGYHQPTSSGSGTSASCSQPGELVTGLCVAPVGASEYQCEVHGGYYDNAIQCAKKPTTGSLSSWLNAGAATTQGGKNGNWVQCPTNQLPTSIGFITISAGTTSSMSFTCSALATGVEMNADDTYTVCDSFPQRLTCAPGYAILSACAGSGCNSGACSGQSSATVMGLTCVNIRGWEYEGLAEGSPVADNSTASWQVVSCQQKIMDYSSMSGKSENPYTITNTVSEQSAVSTSSESTYSNGGSITQTTNSEYEISSQGGLPWGQLILAAGEAAGEAAAARRIRALGTTKTNTTDSGYSVETTFDTSSSYINQQYDSVTVTQQISETVNLANGYLWVVNSWGVATTTAGNYTVNYRQFAPGMSATSVQEQVQQVSTALSDTTYVLVLNNQNYTASYLENTGCQTMATQFMSGSSPFNTTSPSDQSSSNLVGTQLVGPSTSFPSLRRKLLRGRQ